MSKLPLLEVRHLTVAFDSEIGWLNAVDDISFSIQRGECVGLVGESGCGKSAAALSLVRLLPHPHAKVISGEVLFDGRDVLQLSKSKLHQLRGGRIGFIFQEPMNALNPVHTVGDQIAETLMLHRGLSRAVALQEAVKLLRYVRIPNPEQRVHEYPHRLSGGMRQRVVIAIALACRPQLIIADEPTTALDVTVQQQILALLSDLRSELNASSLLISHDLGVIAQNCDRVLVMYAGRIVESAEVHELFDNPRHAYTKALLASMPSRDIYERKSMLPTIPGNVPPIREYVPGCRFCQRMGVAAKTLQKRPELVEVAPGHWVEACPRCAELD